MTCYSPIFSVHVLYCFSFLVSAYWVPEGRAHGCRLPGLHNDIPDNIEATYIHNLFNDRQVQGRMHVQYIVCM